MNSKKLGILVVLLALLTALFVSCNSDVADNSAVAAGSKELVYATFDNSSKGITVDTVVGYKTYDDLFWFYTATKKDSYGTTGQTSELVPVSKDFDGIHIKGLSGKVGPFSQGAWSFTLYAYDGNDTATATLYYQGTTSSDVTLINGVDNYIPVTVTPQGDEGAIAFYNGTNTTNTYFIWKDNLGGEGALRLDISMKDADGVSIACVSKELTKGSDNKYKIEGNILRKTGESTSTEKFPAGVYTVKFEVVDSASGNLVFASQNLALRVYGNLTTMLKGELTEIVDAYGYFEVPEQQINVFIATAEEVVQTVDVVPDKTPVTGVTKKTTVTFEASALDTTNSQHTLKVEVTPIATAATKFNVMGEETAVAGIDFELKKIVTKTSGDVTTTTEETVTKFDNDGSKYATIVTYIAKGFKTVRVVYTGDGNLDQPIATSDENAEDKTKADSLSLDAGIGYNPTTGYLCFKTNHFSEYYVKANVEAINVTTNTVYTTLAEAVAAVDTKQTIQLIKDVTLSNPLEVSKQGKTITLDLNGKTLSGRVNLKAGSLTIKNGTVAGGSNQALNVYGSSTEAENYSVLTVDSDVTVTGDEFAVCLFGKTYDDANGYGAVVNFYGKASTTGTGKEGTIFVSGNLGKGFGLADQKNIINIYGSVTSETDTALALNGNALVNIFEGARLTGNTALTVKRGKLVVNGGTITSTGAKAYPPAGNNNGTEMSGAGVSVTATYNGNGPLAVEISGGTFVSANADAVFKANQEYGKDATISITGGVFSSDPSAYVADGFSASPVVIDNVLWYTVEIQDEWVRGSWFVIEDQMVSVPYGYSEDGNTVLISTNAGFAWFAKQVNTGNKYSGKTVKLVSDIDLLDYYWTPINHFEGTFDGQNYEISNIYVDGGQEGNGFGLFGHVSTSASLKNVKLNNVYVSGNSAIGALVGNMFTGTVDNVHVYGDIYIGISTENGSIPNFNSSYAGGIIGWGYVNVTNSSVKGNDGSAIGHGRQVGGIYGFSGEGNRTPVENCTVENIRLVGKRCVGGVIGWAHYENNIKNCSVKNVTVSITGTEFQTIGLISGTTESEDSGNGRMDLLGNTATDSKMYVQGEEYTSDNVVFDLYSQYGFMELYATDNNGNYYCFAKPSVATAFINNNPGYTLVCNLNLNNLISLSDNNSLIELNADETISRVELSNNKTVTVDLKGHTITSDGTDAFLVKEGTLVIKDTIGGGRVNNTGTDDLVWLQDNGTLVLEGGDYSFGSKYSPVYGPGTLVIKGGSYTVADKYVATFKGYVSKGYTVTINGQSHTGE